MTCCVIWRFFDRRSVVGDHLRNTSPIRRLLRRLHRMPIATGQTRNGCIDWRLQPYFVGRGGVQVWYSKRTVRSVAEGDPPHVTESSRPLALSIAQRRFANVRFVQRARTPPQLGSPAVLPSFRPRPFSPPHSGELQFRPADILDTARNCTIKPAESAPSR